MMKADLPSGGQSKKEDWFGARDLEWLRMSANLKPGRTHEEARAEMALLGSQLVRAYPGRTRKPQSVCFAPEKIATIMSGRSWGS